MPEPLVREIKAAWKPRRKSAHKGDFGRILILAGSKGLTGAAYLTALACLKSGAGLVTLGVPESVYPIFAKLAREVMVKPFPSTKRGSLSLKAYGPIKTFLATQDVLALGPGLSQDHETQKLIRQIVCSTKCPCVLDADALSVFQAKPQLFKKVEGPLILTPHPGEFTRVFGKKLSAIDSVRKKAAMETGRKFGVYMILKGHHTVVASPQGKCYLNSTGNPGMATGGSGDVLTGMIAAFLGQGMTAWNAARFGVYFHGLAGDLAAKKTGQVSLIAGDIIDFLPQAFKKVLGF